VACFTAHSKHQSRPVLTLWLPFRLPCTLTSYGIVPSSFLEFMTPSFLDRLPFDIIFYISSSLHLDDVVHLGQTCRQLKGLLSERTLQRCVVEVCNFIFKTIVHLPKKFADLSTYPGDSARAYWRHYIQPGSTCNLRQKACTVESTAVFGPNNRAGKFLPIPSGCNMHTIR
jgi:hypothetical protein